MTVPTQRSLHLIGLQEYAPGSALMLLLCAALAALSLYTLRRLWRTCRGAAWLGTLCLLGLLPIVNLLPVPFLQLAPYRAALPGIGLCAVFGWLAADASRRAASPQQGALIQTAAAAVLVWNTANTVVGSRTWMREEVLFRSLEHYNPRHPTAHFLLAYFLMTTGRPAEAAEHWQRELTLLYQGTQWRTESGALQGLSDPQIRRSLRQNQGGTWDERIFASSLQTRLAYCLLELRRPAEAAVHYRIAAAVDPNNMDARQGAGYALLQTGDLHESSRYSLQAAEREPDRIDAWVNFVRASAALNDYAAVKRGYAGWMQAAPNQTTPYLELARIQLNRRDLAGAAGTLTEALKKWPDRADIRSLMALVEAGGIETGPPPSP
jgi:tetratricopeptide (TPR) repeat protein